MIRAVTFDVWGTLLGYTPELGEYWRTVRKRAMFGTLKSLGLDYSMDDISKAYDLLEQKVRGEEGLLPNSHVDPLRYLSGPMREMTVHDQVRLFLELLNVNEVQESWFTELVKLYAEALLEKLPSCAKNARKCLSQLKDDDIKLGIVSNAIRTPGRVLRVVLARHKVMDYFDATSFSDEVGIRKPHPEIFIHSLSQLGVKPDEAAHVGDSLRDDIYGAKKVGMCAVLCRSITPFPQDKEILKPDVLIDELAQLPVVLKSL